MEFKNQIEEFGVNMFWFSMIRMICLVKSTCESMCVDNLWITLVMNTVKSDLMNGLIMAAFGFSLFAVGDAVVKYVSAVHSPVTILFYNTGFAALIYILAARWLGGLRSLKTSKFKKLHFLRGILVCAQTLSIFYAFANLPLSTAYAIIFVSPFVACILAWIFFKESIKIEQWLCILGGFAGVLLVTRPGLVPIELPVWACLGSAVSFAVVNLLARRMSGGQESLLAIGFGPIITTFCLLVPIYALHQEPFPTFPHLGLLILTAVLSAAGFILVARGFMVAPAAYAAPTHYIQILWGIGLGYLLFEDVPDWWTLSGSALIIGSGFALVRLGRSVPPEIPAPSHPPA